LTCDAGNNAFLAMFVAEGLESLELELRVYEFRVQGLQQFHSTGHPLIVEEPRSSWRHSPE
jgi:hypothetical protein